MKTWKALLFLGIACVVLTVAQPDEEPASEQPSQISQEPSSDQSSQIAQEPIQPLPGRSVGSFGFCPWHCRRHPWTWRCRRFWGCRRWWGHHPFRGVAADDQSAGVAEEPAVMNEMGGSDRDDDMDNDDGMQMMEGSKDDEEDQTDYKRYLFCPWKCRLLGSLMPHHCSKLEGCRRYLKRTRPDKTKPEEDTSKSGVEAESAGVAGAAEISAGSAEQGEKEDLMIRRPFPHPLPHPIRRPWCPLHCRRHPFAPHCRRWFGCRYWLHRPGLLGVAESESETQAEGDQQGDNAAAEEGAQPEALEGQENSEGRPDDDLRRWQFCPWRCRLMGSLMPWRCRRLPACQRHMRKGLKDLRPPELPVHPSGPGMMGDQADAEGVTEQGQGQEQENEQDAEGRRRGRDDDDDKDDDRDDDKDEDRDEFRKHKFCPKKCRAMGRLSHKMAKKCRRIEACERYMKKRGKHHREMERDEKERDGVESQAQAAQVQAQTQTDGEKPVPVDAQGEDEFSKYKFCPKKCRALALIGHKMPKRCRRLEACERYLEKRTKHQGVKNLPITVKSE